MWDEGGEVRDDEGRGREVVGLGRRGERFSGREEGKGGGSELYISGSGKMMRILRICIRIPVNV